MLFIKIVCVFAIVCFVKVLGITDEEYASMPPVFHLDDFDNCMRYGNKSLYCFMTIQLAPENPSNLSESWKVISEVITHPRYYRHDKIRHGYCINKICPEFSPNMSLYKNNLELLQTDLSSCLDRLFSDYGLKTALPNALECQTIDKEPLDVYDYLGGLFLASLVLLVVIGTFYEGLPRYKSKEEYQRKVSSKYGKIISCFSVIKNWERLGSKSTGADAKSLKVINGVRFYNIMMVIMAHVCLVSFASPISDPSYVEDLSQDSRNMLAVNGYYAIQTFFVMAGWLLTYHFFLLFEEKKEVRFSYILLAFVNRYIRLTPAYLVMIVFNATWLNRVDQGPVWHKLVGLEYENCRKNWWANLLYINNFYDPQHFCIQQSWYLATDTQLFVVALFLLVLMLKFRKYIVHILGFSLVISMVVPGIINYISDYDIVVRQYPEHFYTIYLDIVQWHVMYASPYVNFGGYVIGMIFGYIFYKYRNQKVFTKTWHVILFWVLTWGLPLGTIYIGVPIYQSEEKPPAIISAIYAGVAKVLFSLGVAIGMFGISQNVGWFLRSALTWAPIQILGRLTYCIFLVHTSTIRVRAAIERSPLYSSSYTIFVHTFGDYAVSCIFAVILCLLIELPVSALQKVFIPQLADKREHNVNNKEEQKAAANGEIVREEKNSNKV